ESPRAQDLLDLSNGRTSDPQAASELRLRWQSVAGLEHTGADQSEYLFGHHIDDRLDLHRLEGIAESVIANLRRRSVLAHTHFLLLRIRRSPNLSPAFHHHRPGAIRRRRRTI